MYFCYLYVIQPRTKSVDELENTPKAEASPNLRGCIRKRSRSLKYNKSQSLDDEHFKVHELETTLSSPRMADEQKHENHILCKRLSVLFLANIDQIIFSLWIHKYFFFSFF